MAIVVSESSVAPEPLGTGAQRQRLLTDARVKGTRILLDRWTLAPGTAVAIEVPAANLVWFQVLDGEAVFTGANGEQRLTTAHIVFLPPHFKGSLASARGAALLHAEVPDAGRFDRTFAASPPQLRVVD